MSNEDSITFWIANIKDGKDSTFAQQQIWNRYFHRLAALARKKLSGSPRRVVDEEDVVLAAFKSFFEGARQGEFPQLSDRHSLWPLLAKITVRKAINEYNYLNAGKRKPKNQIVRGESAFLDGEGNLDPHGLDQCVADELTPELADELLAQAKTVINSLPDEKLRTVAAFRLQGLSTTEISRQLNCTKRTVERKILMIRRLWGELPA